jgi:hypothetical protein
MIEMPIQLVWTSAPAVGFELKQFASGLRERDSFTGMPGDCPRKGLRIHG